MALRVVNNRWLNIWLVCGERKKKQTLKRYINLSELYFSIWIRPQIGGIRNNSEDGEALHGWSVYVFKTLIIAAKVVSDWASIWRSIVGRREQEKKKMCQTTTVFDRIKELIIHRKYIFAVSFVAAHASLGASARARAHMKFQSFLDRHSIDV